MQMVIILAGIQNKVYQNDILVTKWQTIYTVHEAQFNIPIIMFQQTQKDITDYEQNYTFSSL